MSTVAILFSNLHDRSIPELTSNRSAEAIPFAGRYRLVDFALSNLVNSNIYNVNLLTRYNYRSIMEHIGSGKEWDLARSSGGIKFLPPFMKGNAFSSENNLYTNRLEAIKSIRSTVGSFTEDYVIMADSNIICNIDVSDIIKYHKSTGADMTAVVKSFNMTKENYRERVEIVPDSDGNIADIKRTSPDYVGECKIYMNISVFNRTYFQNVVNDAIAHNYHSMTFDVMRRNMKNARYKVYECKEYMMAVETLSDYYSASMDMLYKPEVRDAIFKNRLRPVITRIVNSVPTYYGASSRIKNSFIADGCKIHGAVENSIIFRGVTVGKGAVIRNSVVFKNAIIGENAFLNCCLADIGSVVSDSRILSGCEASPYYIAKNARL